MTLRQHAAFPVGNLSAVTESNAFLSQNIYVVNNMKRYSQVLTAQYIYMCFLPKKCYKSDMSLLLFILGIIIGRILIFKFTNRVQIAEVMEQGQKVKTVLEIIATIA